MNLLGEYKVIAFRRERNYLMYPSLLDTDVTPTNGFRDGDIDAQ